MVTGQVEKQEESYAVEPILGGEVKKQKRVGITQGSA